MYGLIDDDAPDFKPCERTVRLCIGAIAVNTAPKQMMDSVYSGALSDAKGALQALLADPAKALVDELAGENAAMSGEFANGAYWAIKRLIDTGRIRSGE